MGKYLYTPTSVKSCKKQNYFYHRLKSNALVLTAPEGTSDANLIGNSGKENLSFFW